MNGFTVTSQRQIEFSRRSEAARECPRIAREATELDMHIRSLAEGAERAEMVSTYGHMVLKRESMCGLKKRQEALNLKITSPLDTTVFMNIRLPFWLRQIFPLHHSMNLDEQVYRAVSGERLYGKCILERGHVHTFDKKTYNYQLDDCYHMVAADCSKRNSHAVLAKEKDNAKHVMIFSENNKIVIEEPATCYTRPTTPFTVKTQTGEERMVSVEVVPDQVAHLLEGSVSVSW